MGVGPECTSSEREPMVVDSYFSRLIELLQNVHQSQRQAISAVARVATATIAGGGMLHLLDSGHFLGSELINRAGGLGAIHKLASSNDINNVFLVRRNDLVILGSVSGRSRDIVEGAILARKRGITTVGLTSMTQTTAAIPDHPSGQLLKDVVDYLLDIGGVAGDAMLDIAGVDGRVCPSSGISAAAVTWAVMAETVALLAASRKPPTVYTSVNVPGGREAYDRQLQRLRSQGY